MGPMYIAWQAILRLLLMLPALHLWGAHGYFAGTNASGCWVVGTGTNWGYATNRTIIFNGYEFEGWHIIETGESFNGDQ